MRFYPNGEGEGQVVARSAEPLPSLATVTLPPEAMARLVGTYTVNSMVVKVRTKG